MKGAAVARLLARSLRSGVVPSPAFSPAAVTASSLPCSPLGSPSRRGVTTARSNSTAVAASNAALHAPPTAATANNADPFSLVEGELATMFREIHEELDIELKLHTELSEMSKYYFDGKGKALRPVIAMCLGHAFNHHSGQMGERVEKGQRKVAIISEMIHTASLVHDDILDHAESRRGKPSVNVEWNNQKSTMCGDYILAVGSKLLAQVGNKDVLEILSQVLTDLVQGEFMQLQTKEEEGERFEHYLSKSFNKTASLMAYSCKANAVLAGVDSEFIEAAFQYGRNIGIAFQLVDDLLDFVSSADMLGKPAAADLELGLATAPVLFAVSTFPELNSMISRRFSQPGDVEAAFSLVLQSNGLQQTRDLARNHCHAAVESLQDLKDSPFKAALVGLCDKVLNRLN